MDLPNFQTLLYAFIGGLLPALLWLWFFLREDRAHPEPRSIIVIAFTAGMLSVLAVIPAERAVMAYASGTTLIILWSAIEEVFKYAAAVIAAFWHKDLDEPVDTIVYMITVALGFAAFETGLFLLEPFTEGDIAGGILTGNLRFMGAALLHTLASAIVGACIAFTFYKGPVVKFISLCTGLILATALHALFNFFIMESNGEKASLVFFAVWLGIIVLFLLFEKAKRVRRPLRKLMK
jgi:RsiW-degrading membrane proteinase PrsW (M82 family)